MESISMSNGCWRFGNANTSVVFIFSFKVSKAFCCFHPHWKVFFTDADPQTLGSRSAQDRSNLPLSLIDSLVSPWGISHTLMAYPQVLMNWSCMNKNQAPTQISLTTIVSRPSLIWDFGSRNFGIPIVNFLNPLLLKLEMSILWNIQPRPPP